MDTKLNILAVDDEVGPLESLKTILNPFYTVYTAGGGIPALEIIKNEKIDLVTLALNMPDLHGMEVLHEIKKLKEDVEVVIITGFGSLKNATEAIKLGASDYILKPFNVSEIISVINSTLEKKRVYDQFGEFLKDFGNFSGFQTNLNEIKETLKDKYSILEEVKQNFDKKNEGNESIGNLEMAKTVAQIFENKGFYSKGHSARLYYYTHLIAQKMDIPPEKQEVLQIAAYIHGIGKMGFEDGVQDPPKEFSSEDSQKLLKNPTMGVDFSTPIGVSRETLDIIQHYDDVFSGGGIPRELQYEAIPLSARIISVADAFDSMVSDRPEGKGLSLEEITSELLNCSGTQFDPKIVEIFLGIIREEQEKLLPKFLKNLNL